MDREAFIKDTFVGYDPMPNSGVINRAIREAEIATGFKVANIAEDSEARTWLVNRTERSALWMLLITSAGEYNYAAVGSRDQIFQHYQSLVDKLDAEWAEMEGELLRQQAFPGGFAVYPPNFNKGSFGFPE